MQWAWAAAAQDEKAVPLQTQPQLVSICLNDCSLLYGSSQLGYWLEGRALTLPSSSSTSFTAQGPISHWHVAAVAKAFRRQEKSGSGFENMTCSGRGRMQGGLAGLSRGNSSSCRGFWRGQGADSMPCNHGSGPLLLP
jgi:hypothetical protein